MAVHICPRCKRQLIPVGVQYCDTCRPEAEAALEQYRADNLRRKQQKYNRRRDPKYAAFRNSKDWKTLSRTFLRDAGYRCQAKEHHPNCNGIAVEAHHIEPIHTPEGWERRLDWDNLLAVSTPCHNVQHPEKGKAQTPAGVIDLRNVKR